MFGGREQREFVRCPAVLDVAITVSEGGQEREYAQQREAYGRPIIKHQAIAHKLAKMEVDIEASRLLIYYAAWLMDQKKPHNVEAAVCKYCVTEGGLRIVDDATRIFGAYGASMEMNIQRYFRDMRWLLYGAGTQTMILNIITYELQRGRR